MRGGALVGGFNLAHLGIWVIWDDEIPNWMESHFIAMFQTTNQRTKNKNELFFKIGLGKSPEPVFLGGEFPANLPNIQLINGTWSNDNGIPESSLNQASEGFKWWFTLW